MVIQLENISKRYGFEWIFKQVNFQFEHGGKYAIIGANGSGKSTLLKIISGGLLPTSGKVHYSLQHKRVTYSADVAPMIAYAAPYIQLIEDFSLEEMYDFHASFKKMVVPDKSAFLELAQLTQHRKKYIKNFSSGMRQRVKLALAFTTQSDVLLLDEPTSNFDTKAIDWYQQLIQQYTQDRLLIIGSNQSYEFDCCSEFLPVEQFK